MITPPPLLPRSLLKCLYESRDTDEEELNQVSVTKIISTFLTHRSSRSILFLIEFSEVAFVYMHFIDELKWCFGFVMEGELRDEDGEASRI